MQQMKGVSISQGLAVGKIVVLTSAAAPEAQAGTPIVLLIPARTDTSYFHDFIYHKAEIRFIKGRLKFGGCKDAAPFPSMVVIFGKEKEHEETEHAGSRGTGKEEA